MTRAMRTEAMRYPGQEQQVMEFFRQNPRAAETLRGPIFEEKVVDFMLELAKVEERDGHARRNWRASRSRRPAAASRSGSAGARLGSRAAALAPAPPAAE